MRAANVPVGHAYAGPMAEGFPNYKLTIGELFPAGDVVGQWVFSLNCLTEDLYVLMGSLTSATEPHDLRAALYFTRALGARLYEANRLAESFRDQAEINAFFNGKIASPTGVDLLELYTPDADGVSAIDRLFGTARHRVVHYPWVGRPELRELLHEHRRYPARLVAERVDGVLQHENQWVTAIVAQDVFGDMSRDGSLERMRALASTRAAVATAWMFASTVMTIVYAKKRGIEIERFVDDPDEYIAILREGKDQDKAPAAS